jgi:predicted signal transduction protein with EAL and GGDEF domain
MQEAHILIIDDDPIIRRLLARTLQKEGMKTSEACAGEQGLEIFRAERADVVLLDVVMPGGMDGFTVCAKIKQQLKGQHVPVLMMTGLDDIESINHAYEAGATDFITKPINIALIGHRVRYMLRSAQATQSLLESENRLHRMAYFDPLTELPNRSFFQEHLQMMISLAERQQQKFGVFFLDIDGFKRINDTLGHLLGDRILQETGRRLRKSLRACDAVIRMDGTPAESGLSLARLGGDEFSVLYSMIESRDEASNGAERIRQALSKPIYVDQHELFTTISMGIAVYPDNGKTAESLLKNADMAMHYAKRDGGNNYRYFSSNMTDAAKRRLFLENSLHNAIERNELELHYQPQLNLEKGKFFGSEALLRWKHQELGWISPVEFIPLAEETGLIVDIGEWVLRQACIQAKIWQGKGLSMGYMAVNVSAVQLLYKDYPNIVAAVLAETGLPPETLELEVTESALIADETSVANSLQSLKDLGVQLAIDDFGTGYSSLSRLINFPIDRLKIDRSFIMDVEQNPAKAAIVVAIIAMAEGMKMQVVAEGVETQGQLAFLKINNCNDAQGYLMSKPLPSANIEEFLNTYFLQKFMD